MQDRLGDLREYLIHGAPGAAAALISGPSVAMGSTLHRGNMFDIEAQMGLNRGANETMSEEFMGDVLKKLEKIKAGIASIRETMGRIKVLKREAVQATSPEQEKVISEELNEHLARSNQTLLQVKKGLEQFKEENEAFTAKYGSNSEAKMRENLHAAVTRKFREMLKEYQTLQTDYKKDVRDKVSRQVRIVFPDANEDEISKIVEEGDMSAAAAIQRRLQQTHESLKNALSDLQDKYRDIRRLEQSVGELHQMFVDLATLVDAQGELLDQIDFSVNSAKDYTEKGEKELVAARKDQKKAKKRMCCLTVCFILLIVIIALPTIMVLTR